MITSFSRGLLAGCMMLALPWGAAFGKDLAPPSKTHAAASTPVCKIRIIRVYPHDPAAFTEGLFFKDGKLYESTGLQGQSRITVRQLADPKPLLQYTLPPTEFGEGITDWGGEIVSITWQNGVGRRLSLRTLRPASQFRFEGEGWGMTHDARRIYQSDGSAVIKLRDPASFAQIGSLAVADSAGPVRNLNELEWIGGEIWANVWMTERIARIHPQTGRVTMWLDLLGLGAQANAQGPDAVLNGIAYDAAKKRIFVTGKNWTKLFEIKPDC